jgi:hypothetical protein
MQNFYQRTPAPCIVNEGILINRADIIRALETLESVKYSFTVDGSEMSCGNGVIVKIFANPDTSTLIVNGCLFINILSFNYLRFFVDESLATVMDLVEDGKALRLVSTDDEGRRNNPANRNIFSDLDYNEEMPVELFEEFDDDDHI